MTQIPAEIWTPAELSAWRMPPEMRPSQWAERYRSLPHGQSPLPGPWENENAPYSRGIMDLAAAPGVAQLNVCKAAQIGVSEAMRNLLGYWAHLDPEPMGLTLPDEGKGRKIVANRVIPMLRQTDVLAELLSPASHDTQKDQVRLVNGFFLHLMWSGSASAMSSDPMCRVLNDEVDKFQPWTGKEGSPVQLTARRLRAYGPRAVQVNISTPTTRMGEIWRLFEASDCQLYFFVPCPHCGSYQRLIFERVRWAKPKDGKQGDQDNQDKKALARRVKRSRAAWYECAACERKLYDSDRRAMMQAGRWATEDGRIADAESLASWPAGTRLGLQISALYCLWVKWGDVASEFILAAHDMARTYDFRTQTLGEPYEQQVSRLRSDVFAARCGPGHPPEGIIPAWAAKLIAAIDTQHDHFWIVMRAWGPNMKSQRVWHGRVETFDELDRLCFRHPWPVEGGAWGPVSPELVLIDTGGTRKEDEEASRTMEVYQWAQARRARVRPIKGAARPRQGLFIWAGDGFLREDATVTRSPSRAKQIRRRKVRIWWLDTHHFSDILADLISVGTAADDEREPIWLLNDNPDEEYSRQMSNMRKVQIPDTSRMVFREEWVPASSGVRHDLYDCEKYHVAGAYMAQVHQLPQPAEMERHRQAAARAAAPAPDAGGDRGGGDRGGAPAGGRPAGKRRGSGWKPSSLSDYV